MLASHDSYTFQKPKNIFYKLISIFWRCQKLDIKQQYDLGVRIFDIRVYRNKQNKWGTAHGFIHFNKSFNTLIEICEYFYNEFPGSIIRIYLEDNVKKNKQLENIFLDDVEDVINSKYSKMIWEIGTHHPWCTSYRNDNFNLEIKEYYCHLFNWNCDKSIIYNLKHFDWNSFSLPLYAKKHNPAITQNMINDDKYMYIMDYIGIYPKCI